MSKIPDVNRNIPQPAQPIADVRSLVHVAQSLKQAIDSLAGYRGGLLDRAVTFRDLVNLGLADTITLQSDRAEVDFASGDDISGERAERIAADAALQAAIDAEEAARIAADDTLEAADVALQAAIDDEEETRAATDADLQSQIDALENNFWEILTTAASTALGDSADYGGIGDTLTTGFNAIDAGSLATVTDAVTAGFTHVDLGRLV